MAKSLFPECFLGAQTSQGFLVGLPKKHFTGEERLRMVNLGNTAYATTQSSQHCFLGAQMGKHFLQKQNVSEKNRKHFLFLGNKRNVSVTSVSFARKQGNIERNVFPQQCFLVCGEPRFNEPLYNEVLGIMNDIFQPNNSVMYGKEPRYNEPISSVPWHFVKSKSTVLQIPVKVNDK